MMLAAAPAGSQELDAIKRRIYGNEASEDDKWPHYAESYKRAWGLDRLDEGFLAAHGTDAGCRKVKMLARVLCPELRRLADDDTSLAERSGILKVPLIEEVIAALGLRSPFDTETVIADLMEVFDGGLVRTEMFKDYGRTARLFRQGDAGVKEWDLRRVVKAVNMVLNAVGLSLVGTTTRVQKQNVKTAVTTYRLNSDEAGEMTELVKLRLRGGSCQPANAHARAAFTGCAYPKYGHLVTNDQYVWHGMDDDL